MDVNDPASRLDVLTNGVAFLSDPASAPAANPSVLPFADAFQRRQTAVNGNGAPGSAQNPPANLDSSRPSASQSSDTSTGPVASAATRAKPASNPDDPDKTSEPTRGDATGGGNVPVPTANTSPAPQTATDGKTDETSTAVGGAPASLVSALLTADSPTGSLTPPSSSDVNPTTIPTGLQAALTEPMGEPAPVSDGSTPLPANPANGKQSATLPSTIISAGKQAISSQVAASNAAAEPATDSSVDGSQETSFAVPKLGSTSVSTNGHPNRTLDDVLTLGKLTAATGGGSPALNFSSEANSWKESGEAEAMAAASADGINPTLPAIHAAMTAASQDAVAGLSSSMAPEMAGTNPTSLSSLPEVPVHSQVHEALLRAGNLDQQLTIVLRPPELGRVQIDVARQDGQLTARLQTETATAHRLLSEHLPQLQETFAQMGLNADQVQVVRNDPSSASTGTGERLADGWSDQQAGQSPQHQQPGSDASDPQWLEEPEAVDSPVRNLWTRTALNLRV